MPEKFDPVRLIQKFNRKNIRYLLIGRQAVVQYGAPLFSFDYDFWIHPDDMEMVFEIIESFGLTSGSEDRPESGKKKPIVIFDDDEGNKVDVFFAKALASQKKEITIILDKALKRSVIKKDPDSDFSVRIPQLDDLILLKQLGDMAPKDFEDVEYLESIRENFGNK